MSNLKIVYLNQNYSQTDALSLLDKQLISFIKNRNHQILNLKLFNEVSASLVYEKTLSYFKQKPLVIIVLPELALLPLTLLTNALWHSCRCLVFSKASLHQQFKVITNKQLFSYPLENSESIINTLKLFSL